MAFLGGVLESIKEDESVTKYDKNVAEPKLDSVLNSLEVSIGKGSGALVTQVEKVSGWLGRYESEVKEKCEEFKKPIVIMRLDIKKNLSDHKFEELKQMSLSDQHARWKKRGELYFENAKQAQSALENFDAALSGKLRMNVSLLLQATESFKRNAEDEDLKIVFGLASQQMTALTSQVEGLVNAKRNELQGYLTTQMGHLHRRLEIFKSKQFAELFNSVNYDLQEALNVANGVINNFENSYDTKIVSKVGELVVSAPQFSTKFGATKTALENTIENLRQDIARVRLLTAGDNDIDSPYGGKVDARFLKAIGTQSEPFKTITDHLSAIDKQIMQHVKAVMDKIGEKWVNSGAYPIPLQAFFRNVHSDLTSLVNVVKTPRTVAELTGLQGKLTTILGDGAKNISDIRFTNATSFQTLVQKFANPSGVTKELTSDLQKLLAEVGTVAKTVSQHSHQVVTTVMEKIRQRVEGEITDVANAIEEKVKRIQGGIKGVKDGDEKYGLAEAEKNARGLTMLVNEFKSRIDDQLKILLTSVGSKDNTKKNNTDSVFAELNDLKDKINDLGKTVNTVKDKIQAARMALRLCIQHVEMLMTEMSQKTNQFMNQLRRRIDLEITNAFTIIKNKAKEMYSARKENELRALEDIVNKQFDDITKTIEQDKTLGIKGFFDRLQKTFITPLNTLASPVPPPKAPKPFEDWSSQLNTYFNALSQSTSQHGDIISVASQVRPLRDALNSLFQQMTTCRHFHDEVSKKRERFAETLDKLSLDGMNDAQRRLLAPLKKGFHLFVNQLRKAYVSSYSGKTINWSDEKNLDKTNCAQILVTILSILNHDLRELHKRCHKTNGDCRENKISLISKSGVYNPLGAFFQDSGYRVSKLEESYEGELRCHEQMRGGHISRDLFEKITLTADTNKHFPKCKPDEAKTQIKSTSQFNIFHILDCLTSHVSEYYQSCHLGLPKSKKYPCSVRDICVWLSGLPHTAVYKTVDGHCKKMLYEQDKSTGIFYNQDDKVMERSLQHLNGNITKTCNLSHRLLVSIQGHGCGYDHAAYPYACCFENNHGQFYYPGDPSSLLGMLKDMCTRLLRAVRFLYQQCRYTASDGNGWRECQYGYRVGSYQWDCDKSSTKPKSQAKCQPNSEPNDQPNCLPKSPLQAHLMDGLPGFMPHKFTAVGCQPSCTTCPKGSLVGQCITPMGFADLATAGSITGRGEDLIDVLSDLCKNSASVLCDLVHALQCILPSPPKGLAEMLSYYCNIMQKSYGSVYGHDTEYKGKIDEAIHLSFPFKNDMWLHNKYSASKLTHALNTLYCSTNEHPDKLSDETHRGLHTVSPNPRPEKSNQCSTANSTCAPYLKALCHDAHHTYPAKHANMYLSWLCRLAWTFWDLLDQLLKAFNNISCQTYGCLCKCGFGKHGVTEEETSQPPNVPKPSCHCTSIVQCKGPMSVFYQYGFTFGMPKELMGFENKKTCDNFVKQLTRVLTKGYFKELFDEIDDFIWAIRTPFSYLLLALWSLSLLYLAHIAVVRLDVLRIRSHLRSPSSHRIAAQSLLAAARVKALANVKYFSP
ncbi:hypothetical protein, conserved [Babesia ovata]|uniref:C3H1-type domain-containing protein n=1 Tax=Babesia ovata TaxID=189622 RepID=A0A2H6KJH4_9APIC|nr:uncharacterized protein BOVATA_046310 [Babesia ovata]GBE63138.1 hypothetical protein, conserved [Babesia ovata]